MNNVNMIGYLATEPRDNSKSVSFLLAVHRLYKGKDGDTDFVPVVVFGKLMDVILHYTHKGSQLGVTGSIKTSQYTDKDGNTRNGWEVVGEQVFLLDSKPKTQPKTYEPRAKKPDPFASYVKKPTYETPTEPTDTAPKSPMQELDIDTLAQMLDRASKDQQ